VKVPSAALKYLIPLLERLGSSDVAGGRSMIDMMQRRSAPGLCDLCGKQPATRRAKFSAQYLQSTSSPIFEEESLVGVEVEKRVCEQCLTQLQNAKNVSNLTFERL
jgi:hypothetical protein